MFLEILQNSQENTCARDSFFITLLKKSLWHRWFPVNFAKFLRTPFFAEHLRWLLKFISRLFDSRHFRHLQNSGYLQTFSTPLCIATGVIANFIILFRVFLFNWGMVMMLLRFLFTHLYFDRQKIVLQTERLNPILFSQLGKLLENVMKASITFFFCNVVSLLKINPITGLYSFFRSLKNGVILRQRIKGYSCTTRYFLDCMLTNEDSSQVFQTKVYLYLHKQVGYHSTFHHPCIFVYHFR